jgi:AbrB family looped-hinge helix DNA binding protein
MEKVLVTTKINKDGRIYIPKRVRNKIKIGAGDEFTISVEDNVILLEGIE